MTTETTALLVTGAAGKTGSYTAKLLLERGHRVRALVHRFDERAATLRDRGAEVVVGDLNDIDVVSEAAEGVRAAYFVYPISPGLLEATATFAQAAEESEHHRDRQHVANLRSPQCRQRRGKNPLAG